MIIPTTRLHLKTALKEIHWVVYLHDCEAPYASRDLRACRAKAFCVLFSRIILDVVVHLRVCYLYVYRVRKLISEGICEQ
jgi:hypothetical protein